jgi:hypothetical protein
MSFKEDRDLLVPVKTTDMTLPAFAVQAWQLGVSALPCCLLSLYE